MKKRRVAIFCLFLLILSPFFGTNYAQATTTEEKDNMEWPKGPSVFAESAIIMEASTGLVLYDKNMDVQHYPASITKIMTVLLALENSSLGDIVTFSKNAVYDIESNSSRIYVDVGEQIAMQQCLYAILLESANDVAYGVAEHVGGSIENFAKMMNDKAKSLGCKNTNFVNPHGLPDEKHLTTAYDMALITREAMKNESFRKVFGTRSYQLPPTNKQPETRYWVNHHKFIKDQVYHYKDCIGGKTGYTDTARYTLVSVAKRGDLELICVIMKDDTSEHQYTDTQKLFDYAFDNFSVYPIADSEAAASSDESPLFTRYNSLLSETQTPISTDKNGFVVLPNNVAIEDAKKEVTFFSSVSEGNKGSEAAHGKVIGKISYTYDGKYVGGSSILYNDADIQPLIPAAVDKNNPTSAPSYEAPAAEKSGGSLRPIIIGIIIGFIVITVGMYYIMVERPRLKRRNAYYKKRALRKMFKNDDYLDL